ANISASPFHLCRDREREDMFATRARDISCLVAFCNAVGAQDELIFDGHSLVLDEEGAVVARAPGFEEALLMVAGAAAEAVGRRLRDLRRRSLARERQAPPEAELVDLGAPREQADRIEAVVAPAIGGLEKMGIARELGLRDYVEKNGVGDVVLGVSGGIDSALTAALAVEALGAERVHCVSMPPRFSTEGTRRD